jgi:transcriptional regulator with XRE-family HTH domain
MHKLRVADTPLAHWLNRAMANYVDPETLVRGISQNQLRARSGISQATIWEILKQGHTPKPETLSALAEFFNVNPLVLHIYAYLSEDEAIGDEDTRTSLLRIARLMETLPQETQDQFVEELAVQAEAILVASDRWESAVQA